MSKLFFFLNGKRVELTRFEPETTLLSYLRTEGYTGSKLGCGEGGCGACTVMISHFDATSNSVVHRSVNGCLMPLAAVDGFAVTTVEGLGNTRDGLNVVQQRIADSNGSQCGFCTPGIVMALYAFLRSHPKATKEEIEDCMDGNLCRCTGYRPILDAAKTFAIEEASEVIEKVSYTAAELVQAGEALPPKDVTICPSTGKPCDCGEESGSKNPQERICFDPSRITSHLIFPPALKKLELVSKIFKGERVSWYRPVTMDELLSLKKEHPGAKLVVGNTEIGIERKFKHANLPVIIAPTHVPELNQISTNEKGISIGSSVTLANLEKFLSDLVKTIPAYQTPVCYAILKQLKWFAGHQIRNAAAVGGNICTASPISDLNPVFIAAHATLVLASTEGESELPIREFFLRYRVTNMKEDQVLKSIFVPFTRENEYFHAYKQARRRDDDIAIVTSGIRLLLEDDGEDKKIKEIAFGYGGMAPTTVFCKKTEEKLVGMKWDQSLLPVAYKLLEEDLPLPPNAPGGMIQFRRTLTTSFFYKFFLRVTSLIYPDRISTTDASAIPDFHKPISSGKQNFQTNPKNVPVSAPVVHAAAHKQVCGEAIYTDDMDAKNSLFAAFVMSKRAHAKIVSINTDAALAARGVVAFYGGNDVLGKNEMGPIIRNDEPLFPVDIVTAMHQPIGIIVAATHEDACEAALLVEIEYEDLPTVIGTRSAIEQKQFYKPIHSIVDGDVDAAFKSCDHIVSGEMESGAQDHFYLEPNTSFAMPGEGEEMVVVCSTQNPTKTQQILAHILNISDAKITVKVKRMGGGFGGKETRSIQVSAAAALAAYKLRRPVKFVLDRDVDMLTTGMRHPFVGQYKVGFNKDGKVQALEIDLYSNAGNSMDLSISVMERALFHVDNCYKIPNVKATGYCCRTNTVSNTAFRGFGGPQSMLICENWIEQISYTLNMDVHEIRKLNFYKDGEKTHYQQIPSDNHIERLYAQTIESSEYARRVVEVEKFNLENRWKKRGIYVLPTKFGMSFTAKFLNQAGALVHVYTDGSVLVTHGGTEMGQGLHTKIIQIAARAFQIPVERVHISETSTDKVPNTSPTAASVQSDLNGMAVLNACEIILERLKDVRKRLSDNGELSWERLVSTAYFERVDLSAHGFYATPNVGYDFATSTGSPFNYFVWGSACTEVEIDVLTGDNYVRRTDIVMDLGESLNPTIDIGQIEGAFVQGLGWCTLEEIIWFDNGYQFTRGPGNYKIPSFNDVPVDFRVSLLKDSANKKGIHSSKGVGEPPFFLGASALFAIKQACRSARLDAGLPDEYFQLPAPATSEKIRLCCADSFTAQFKQ